MLHNESNQSIIIVIVIIIIIIIITIIIEISNAIFQRKHIFFLFFKYSSSLIRFAFHSNDSSKVISKVYSEVNSKTNSIVEPNETSDNSNNNNDTMVIIIIKNFLLLPLKPLKQTNLVWGR